MSAHPNVLIVARKENQKQPFEYIQVRKTEVQNFSTGKDKLAVLTTASTSARAFRQLYAPEERKKKLLRVSSLYTNEKKLLDGVV